MDIIDAALRRHSVHDVGWKMENHKLQTLRGEYNNTIQYNTTLFYYVSHTQQKLVSRRGVGKHITLQ